MKRHASRSAESGASDFSSQSLEWTKAILLPLVTVLITVVGGYYFTNLTREREARQAAVAQARDTRDSNDRLYAQLFTQREQSDAQVRKDMFGVLINHFLAAGDTEDLGNKVLQLELLASNFDQSLDLAPLFKDVARRLTEGNGLAPAQTTKLKRRLRLTASNLIYKQVTSLSRNGFVKEWWLGLQDWQKSLGKPFFDETIPKSRLIRTTPSAPIGDEEQIRFAVELLDVNIEEHQVLVRLRVNYTIAKQQDVDRAFWVGDYDFPMLDNTQLSDGLRTSVVITDFYAGEAKQDREANSAAKFQLVVFPAANASFKERQDYDDIINDMLRADDRRMSQQTKEQ
jgi:hypothetical protein